jgi:hypothetical protein
VGHENRLSATRVGGVGGGKRLTIPKVYSLSYELDRVFKKLRAVL